jgi:signal transduction histidine kinase
LALPVLLRHLVEEACSMVGARYGALGVLDDYGTGLADLVTVGLDDETERAIGSRPKGKGVLGILITDPHPVRLANLGTHPDSYGFPPNHPPMTSFLGVPVTAHGDVYGNLYLTEKIGWPEFTPDDEALVMGLAQAAGIVIENARLHGRVRDIAIDDDRDRIARDLHDAVIQRLFAIGLSLQGIMHSATPSTSERLSRAIADIDDTIRQIRSSIFELSSASDRGGARSRILTLVRELEVLGFEAHVTFGGPIDSSLRDPMVDHVLFVLREALTNVGRHAKASRAKVNVRMIEGECVLTVADNGIGIQPVRSGPTGLGLHNLRTRAEVLGGHLLVQSSGEGTTLEWRAPAGAI